jgi:hypothetical protein
LIILTTGLVNTMSPIDEKRSMRNLVIFVAG